MRRGRQITTATAALIEKRDSVTRSQLMMLLAGLFLRDRAYQSVTELKQDVHQLQPEIEHFLAEYDGLVSKGGTYSWDDALTLLYFFNIDDRLGHTDLKTAALLGSITRSSLQGVA